MTEARAVGLSAYELWRSIALEIFSIACPLTDDIIQSINLSFPLLPKKIFHTSFRLFPSLKGLLMLLTAVQEFKSCLSRAKDEEAISHDSHATDMVRYL
jgi:hypothetical protein